MLFGLVWFGSEGGGEKAPVKCLFPWWKWLVPSPSKAKIFWIMWCWVLFSLVFD